ncbi:hypothetical protein BDW59DRAFT_137193 [Aspergillus cavernicola]|uniref:Uncharacterized protein n=1 Tax=Aspergillus cavernicola TaxID=176166 RepID=A0ABR4J5H0_9EURO
MAEMTCGFFIICLPCIPKIVKETGIVHHIKKLSKASGRKPYNGSYELGTDSHVSSNQARLNKLNEDAVRMKSLEASESTERLHDGARSLAITRTTQFTVTEGHAARQCGGS